MYLFAAFSKWSLKDFAVEEVYKYLENIFFGSTETDNWQL